MFLQPFNQIGSDSGVKGVISTPQDIDVAEFHVIKILIFLLVALQVDKARRLSATLLGGEKRKGSLVFSIQI